VKPPVISTLPDARRVARWASRGVLIGAGSNMNEFVDGSNSSADETMLLAKFKSAGDEDRPLLRSVIVKKSRAEFMFRPL